MTVLSSPKTKADLNEYCYMYDVGYWSNKVRHYKNPPHILEWYDLINKVLFGEIARLCVIAPREHAKSEVFAVNTATWCAHYGKYLGINWVYIFCDTQPQSNEILDRIVESVRECYPDYCYRPGRWERRDKIFSNGFRVTVRGAEASVRGAHPDLIIGDDVLSDNNSNSNATREKVKNWWRRTVTNMAKPNSKIIIEGTVQHELDLLMSLEDNPAYVWRRYPAWKEI